MNSKNHVISRLDGNDVAAAVSLVLSSFHPLGLLHSIYRGSGVSAHISNELKNPFSAYEYFVVKAGTAEKELAGFCECRMLPAGIVCLNMIATAPAYKWCGIGTTLMDFCIDHYREAGKTELILDVAYSNEPAFHWYQRKGFCQYKEKRTYKLSPLNAGRQGNDIQILNYPQYVALLSRYGFGYIDLMIQDQILKVGVIGNEVFINNCRREDDVKEVQAAIECLGFDQAYLVTSIPYYSRRVVLTDIVAGMRMRLDMALAVMPDGRLQNRQ